MPVTLEPQRLFGYRASVLRTILLYAVSLALAAFLLQWLGIGYSLRTLKPEWYIAIVAVFFAGLGAWVALQLVPDRRLKDFEPNREAIEALGLTSRECEVLDLLADGRSYKEIARRLHLTPNTVKTHVSSLYRKLDVGRRTHAVTQARQLSIIP